MTTETTNELVRNVMSVTYPGPSYAAVFTANPVSNLVAAIIAECDARGLTLSRWQANKGNHATTITYAIHSGERAAQFRWQADDTVIDYCRLSAIEGKTERCAAYKALAAMLADLRAD